MFKLDSPLMNFLNKVADIMILNIIVIIFSLPLFTMGAAFTAAYYIGYKMVKNEESYIIRGFWHSFKDNFRQSTILWIIMLAVAGIIAMDYRIVFFSGMEFSRNMRIVMIVATIVLAMGAVYIFPMQARYTNTIKNTLKNSFLMALAHLPTSFVMVVVFALPVALAYFIPQILPATVLLALGCVLYFQSFLLMKIFGKYESMLLNGQEQEDGAEENDGETDEAQDKDTVQIDETLETDEDTDISKSIENVENTEAQTEDDSQTSEEN